MSDQLTADRLAIRETVENWVLWRDAGDWDRCDRLARRRVDDSDMVSGPCATLHRGQPRGFNKGVNILHARNG
jgi:hypothetical protein